MTVTPLQFGLVAHVKLGEPRPEKPREANPNALLCKCKRILSTKDTLVRRVAGIAPEVYYFCSHCGSYFNPATGKKMCNSW